MTIVLLLKTIVNESMFPANPLAFEQLISKPRLDSYRGYFNVSRDEAIGLYMWNCEVAACWGTLLAYLELVLRNSIHRELSLFYSVRLATAAALSAGHPPTAAAAIGQRAASASIHWYDTPGLGAELPNEARSQIIKARQTGYPPVLRTPAPTPDEIISRVTFGFWPAVLRSIPRSLANQVFPRIFPSHALNAPAPSWNVNTERKKALACIYAFNGLRNRLAHIEPLWKFAAFTDPTTTPPTAYPASVGLADSLARFRWLLQKFDDTVGSISPAFHAEMAASSWRRTLDFLLSPQGVSRYQQRLHCPASAAVNATDFANAFQAHAAGNQPVLISDPPGRGMFDPF